MSFRVALRRFWVSLLGTVALLGLVYYAGVLRTRYVSGRSPSVNDISKTPDLRRLVEKLPQQATDIEYRIQPHGNNGETNFSLREKDLIAWVAEEGWTLKDLKRPYRFTMRRKEKSIDVVVNQGYYRDDGIDYREDDDAVIIGYNHSLIFDKEDERVYYWPYK